MLQNWGRFEAGHISPREDVLIVAYTDILRAVNVETSSGRVYKVNKSEQDEATRLNKSRI